MQEQLTCQPSERQRDGVRGLAFIPPPRPCSASHPSNPARLSASSSPVPMNTSACRRFPQGSAHSASGRRDCHTTGVMTRFASCRDFAAP
jgi:hypothetical protein